MASTDVHKNKIITLNVGGTLFMTTVATLCSKGDNLLSKMITYDLSGQISTTKDASGAYFIDRNGRFLYWAIYALEK